MPSPASPPGLWRRFTAAYARFLTGLLAFSVAIIIIPVTLQMISRYTALIPSYIWTEEMARFLFIWMIMIGAMIGVREGTQWRANIDADELNGYVAYRQPGAGTASQGWPAQQCSVR